MTLDRLTLMQRVYIDDELVAEKRLARTQPREGLYERYMGDFALDAKRQIRYRAGNEVFTVFYNEMHSKYGVKIERETLDKMYATNSAEQPQL